MRSVFFCEILNFHIIIKIIKYSSEIIVLKINVKFIKYHLDIILKIYRNSVRNSRYKIESLFLV